MRFLGNLHEGRLFAAPTPLELSPGRPLWGRFHGEEFRVFIDESFFQFFGLNNPDGNFCHAAVGIPTVNYGKLQQRLASVVQAYNARVLERTGEIPNEVKSSVFRTLPISFQMRFARVLTTALQELGGFVSGFFTPTRGFVMESVREHLIRNAVEVPRRHHQLYEEARQRLTGRRAGPGQANLISNLLLLPVLAIRAMLSSFNCPFRVQYDPRHNDEDRAVRDAIGEVIDRLLRGPGMYGHGNYRGMDLGQRSEDEFGLQIADLLASFVRDFFRNNLPALTYGTTHKLITAISDEPLQKFDLINGVMFKVAALQRMPSSLRRIMRSRNSSNLISYFYPVLAAGMLTCVTSNGQERDLEASTGMIIDLVD